MLYNLAIVIYDLLVHFAAPFSRKPRKMMKGHWVVYELLRQQVEKGEQYIWFHAASLGEFEQGRPLIEMIREKYPDYNFCGHNIKEFDIPYICRRMLINNLPMPLQLQINNRKPWEVNLMDTLDYWKFGDCKNYTSLRLLTAVFGIPSPKDDIDGSQVARVYYKENNLPRISAYCQKDVLAPAQAWRRMNGKAIISSETVQHI